MKGNTTVWSAFTSEEFSRARSRVTSRSNTQTLLHDNIRIYEQGPSAAHYTNPCLNLSGVSAGSASILSASGSCASCWEFIASTLGASYSAGDLIEPHGVVLIGETKFFSRPSRNLIFQEMVALSSSRRTRTLWPRGAKSAYPRQSIANCGQALTQE